MAKYFNNVNSLEELRKQYKELLKKHHPDNANGSTEACQEINAEYDSLFKLLKDKHESKEANNSNTNTKSNYNTNIYDWGNDKALRDVLEKIINFDGIEIEIVGAWIWVSGNTYPHKDELKTVGFIWSKQHNKWHWHNGEFKRYGHKKLSYSEIKYKYGSIKVQTDSRVLLEA